MGGQSRCRPPLCAGVCAALSTSRDFSLDALLFTQFVRKTTEREAREEIWSSVNYLFFISTSFFYNLFYYFILFIYCSWIHWVFVAARGLFSGCGERGLLFVAVRGLLIMVPSFVAEHEL